MSMLLPSCLQISWLVYGCVQIRWQRTAKLFSFLNLREARRVLMLMMSFRFDVVSRAGESEETPKTLVSFWAASSGPMVLM